MENWKTYKLSEISEKITKGTTPTTGGDSFVKSGVNFIKAESVTLDGRIDETKFAFITKKTHEKQKRSQLMKGDILFSMAGVILGKTAIVKSEHLPANTNQALALIRLIKDLASSKFVYYYLQQSRVFNFVNNSTSQSAQPNINLGQIGNLEIVLPPIQEQKAIAKILSSLDDKIELNRQMNATLEAMARALFKAWFVDFEPVRANMENRPSESASPEIAKLFPSEFENDIPKGWQEKQFNEFIDFVNERVNASPEKDNEKYIALEDMPSKSIDLSKFRLGSEVNSSIIRFRKDDLLFGSMRPYFHKVGIAQFNGITRTTTFVLRPKAEYYKCFSLFHLFSDEVIEYSTTNSVGSTIPYVKWETLGAYKVSFPTIEIATLFEHTINRFLQKITVNGEEIKHLAEIRDSLLPRLVSGKIRVGEIENKIQGAIE
jgi:type I restriction enzyme S subunit